MNMIQRVLLIPAITPLIAVLCVSILNHSKTSQIRILTWKSPSISIGMLMTLSSSSGFIIASSAGLISTARRQSLSGKVYLETDEYEDSNPIDQHNNSSYNENYEDNFYTSDISPERSLKDPAPTISVPFRVIKSRTINRSIDDYDDQSYSELDDQYSYPDEHSSEKEDKYPYGDYLNDKRQPEYDNNNSDIQEHQSEDDWTSNYVDDW